MEDILHHFMIGGLCLTMGIIVIMSQMKLVHMAHAPHTRKCHVWIVQMLILVLMSVLTGAPENVTTMNTVTVARVNAFANQGLLANNAKTTFAHLQTAETMEFARYDISEELCPLQLSNACAKKTG